MILRTPARPALITPSVGQPDKPAIPTSRPADAYAAIGWAILPLHWPILSGNDVQCSCRAGRLCGGDGKSIGKHPIPAHGLKEATTDPSIIAEWRRRWPMCNLAVATGAVSKIIVLDVDPRNGGDESLAELIGTYGPLPETVLAATGGGGRHFVFEHPGTRIGNSKGKIGPGLDGKGDGGYIVAPPSLHASGRRYRWVNDPWHYQPAPISDWLLEKMLPKPEPAAPPVNYQRPLGTRDAFALDRAIRYTARMPGAISGQGGHSATFAVACACRRFGLSESEMRSVMEIYNQRADPPWSQKELAHKIEQAIKVVADVGSKLKMRPVDAALQPGGPR
jgi:hypothetical protein